MRPVRVGEARLGLHVEVSGFEVAQAARFRVPEQIVRCVNHARLCVLEALKQRPVELLQRKDTCLRGDNRR